MTRVESTMSVLVAIFLSIAAAGLVIVSGSASSALGAPLVLIGVTCVALVWFAFRIENDLLSPVALVAYLFGFLYVLRPLYIVSTRTFGSARSSNDSLLNHTALVSMTHALWIVLTGLVVSAVLYVLLTSRNWPLRDRVVVRRLQPVSLRSQLWLRTATIASAALAVLVYAILVVQAGGPNAYFSALANRSEFFFGRSFLTLANVPVKVMFLVLVAAYASGSETPLKSRWFAAGLFSLIVLTDLLSGGRAALLLGTLLPVAIVWRLSGRRLLRRTAIVLILVSIFAFVAARAAIRDYAFQGDASASRVELVKRSFDNLPKTVMGGHEAIPFDSFAIMLGATGAPVRHHLRGQTYVPLLTFVIPRALWPDKPLGGGNVWFTQRYYPRYFGKDRVETSASGLGELYANFGAFGAVTGMALVVAIVGLAYARVRRSPSVGLIVQLSIGIAYMLTWFRGDAFHSLTGWLFAAACAEIARRVIVRGGVLERSGAFGRPSLDRAHLAATRR